jgi:carbon-monoxide dehydrogenase small subunit
VNRPKANIAVRALINGIEHTVTVQAQRTLAELLREDLLLTGTNLGCEQGQCGSCTVLVDGVSARACLMLAATVDGRSVITVEGLADGVDLNILQRACQQQHSFQCGFCASGMLIVATELLAENQSPTEAEVREALSGNLCRCTGYDSIVAGLMAAAAELRVQVGESA